MRGPSRLITAAAICVVALAACSSEEPAPTPTPVPTPTMSLRSTLNLSRDDFSAGAAMVVDTSKGTTWLWASCAPTCGGPVRDQLWALSPGSGLVERVDVGSIGCAESDTAPAMALDEGSGRMILTACNGPAYVVVNLRNKTAERRALSLPASSVAVDPVTRLVYLSTEPGVVIAEELTGTIVATVDAGNSGPVVALPGIKRLAVANLDDKTVTLLDTETRKVATVVQTPEAAVCIAANTKTNRLLVSDTVSENLTAIDAAAGSVVATTEIGVPVCSMSVDVSSGRVYVANLRAPTVLLLREDTLEPWQTLVVGRGPTTVGVNPKTQRAHVRHTDGTVTIIDTTTP